MFRHISVKLSIILSLLLLLIITGILLITHSLFNSFFVNYITEELLHRGHGYAEVLSQQHHSDYEKVTEEHYQETLAHIASMEMETISDVIVIDINGIVLISSEKASQMQLGLIDAIRKDEFWHEEIIEMKWEDEPFIITRSPIINSGVFKGAVYMFTPTQPIRDAVSVQLNILMTVWLGSIFIGVIFILILSRIITKPVLEMNRATEKISKGRYDIEVLTNGNDELADLGKSINGLARNLQHYEMSRHEFLADIAHELRTPLTYLKGYSELLVKGEIKEQAEIHQFHQTIYDQAKRLQRLVQDIMTLNQLDQTHFSLIQRNVNIIHLIQDTIHMIQPLYQDKNVNLVFTYEEDNMVLYIDGERMTQVIINLLDNALRHTSKEGTVSIDVSNWHKNVKITIADTGTGIPSEELPYIWSRLYRAEKSRSRDTGGSGLGLTIVKKIVELHYGDISVASEYGKGSTFIIYLQKQ